jgi:predicted negative regulator of RcsB-dependent stress response
VIGQHPLTFRTPPGFGVRQSSAALHRESKGAWLEACWKVGPKSGRGLPHSKTLARYLAAVVISSFLLAPCGAHAHGELLIRIAAASRVIATNATAESYVDRGELYRQDQNWEAAEADYAQATRLGIKADTVDLHRAQMEADRNRLDAAKAILDRIILRSPGNGKAFLARAHIYVRQSARSAAIADYKLGSRLGVELDSEAFLEWAQMLVAENQAREALVVLDQGIEKFGPINALQVCAVDLELGRKNSGAALERLQTIIDHADRKERWLARRGDIQLAAGKEIEARQSYEAALGAIRMLPAILQRTSPMLNLKTQINAALAKISPTIGKVN